MARNAFVFVFATDHKAGDVLQKHQGDFALATQLNKVRALLCRFAEQHTVIRNDANGHALDMRKPANQSSAKPRLELMHLGTIHNAGDDVAHVIRLACVCWYHAVNFFRVIQGWPRCDQRSVYFFFAVEARDGFTRQRNRMCVVVSQMVGHAR